MALVILLLQLQKIVHVVKVTLLIVEVMVIMCLLSEDPLEIIFIASLMVHLNLLELESYWILPLLVGPLHVMIQQKILCVQQEEISHSMQLVISLLAFAQGVL